MKQADSEIYLQNEDSTFVNTATKSNGTRYGIYNNKRWVSVNVNDPNKLVVIPIGKRFNPEITSDQNRIQTKLLLDLHSK